MLPKEKRNDSLAPTGKCCCTRMFQMEISFAWSTSEDRYTKQLRQENPVLYALMRPVPTQPPVLFWARYCKGAVALSGALSKGRKVGTL